MNIQFWCTMPDWKGQQGLPTNAGQVAKWELGCTLTELRDAFKIWSDAGMPEWYFHPLKTPTGIGISAHGINEEGWGRVAPYRTWGKTHRNIKVGTWFTLELSVP